MINKENFNEKAEQVITELMNLKRSDGKPVPIFSTSQIRKILALVVVLDNKIDYSKDLLDEASIYTIQSIYVKFVYQAGREPSIKNLIEKAKLFDLLKNIQNNKKSQDYKLLVDYIEALVAWRKFMGGKDQ